jgi:hypothetical protein
MIDVTRAVIGCAGFLMLAGCAALPAAGIGAGAALAAPEIPTWIAVAEGTGAVLSDTAKLACAVQAAANLAGNAKLSADAGMLCRW